MTSENWTLLIQGLLALLGTVVTAMLAVLVPFLKRWLDSLLDAVNENTSVNRATVAATKENTQAIRAIDQAQQATATSIDKLAESLPAPPKG